jgi:GNAT superfamily N-acetyltransferase
VTIELVELVQPPGIPQWRWQPFEVNPNYMREDWWHQLPNVASHQYPLYSARIDGGEVARVQLERTLNFEHCRRAGLDHAGALGIARIEVESTLRTRGIGKAVVAAIATKFPDARLVAFSVNADGFWGDSLHWERFDPDGPGQGVMFVAPVGWTGVQP